jgi:adenylate kinase
MVQKKKIAVSVLGPPGSGKDTEAALVAAEYGIYHFKTSQVLVDMFKKNPDDPIYRREYEMYKRGELCTPSFVFDVVSRRTREIAEAGGGIVYSGSPRTKEEVERLTPLLEELFGTDHVLPLYLSVPDEDVIWRNTHRKMCEQCSSPVRYSEATKDLKECPLCGGKLIVRELDTPEMIRERLKVFRRDTGPVLDYYRARGMLREVDGRPVPEKVFADIKKIINAISA